MSLAQKYLEKVINEGTERGTKVKVHVADGSEDSAWFTTEEFLKKFKAEILKDKPKQLRGPLWGEFLENSTRTRGIEDAEYFIDFNEPVDSASEWEDLNESVINEGAGDFINTNPIDEDLVSRDIKYLKGFLDSLLINVKKNKKAKQGKEKVFKLIMVNINNLYNSISDYVDKDDIKSKE